MRYEVEIDYTGRAIIVVDAESHKDSEERAQDIFYSRMHDDVEVTDINTYEI